MVLPSLQLALNLTGQSKDPLVITWESIGHHTLGVFAKSLSQTDFKSPAYLNLCYCQLFNAYIFNDTSRQYTTLEEIYSLPLQRVSVKSHFVNTFYQFLDGLVAVTLLKNHKKAGRRIKKILKESLAGIHQKVERKHINCVAMLTFLEAEVESLVKKTTKNDSTIAQYRLAISQFARTGCTHWNAMANERLADFLRVTVKDAEESKYYYSQAIQMYKEWNAVEKVKRLGHERNIHSQFSTHHGSALRGKERFLEEQGVNNQSRRTDIAELQASLQDTAFD